MIANHHHHHQTVVTTHQTSQRIVVNGQAEPPSTQLNIETQGLQHQLGSDFAASSAWRFLIYEGSTNLNRRFQSTTQIGHVVYLFGGETKVKTSASPEAEQVKHMLNDLHSYDIKTDKWTMLDPGSNLSPSPRKGAILLAHGNAVYLFGGAGPGVCYNDLWKWDTLTQRWHDLTTLAIRKLLASEAIDSPEVVQQIEQYIEEGKSGAAIAQQLAVKRPLDYPAGRAYHCGVVYNDSLIVYGGYGFKNDNSSALWAFDLIQTKWRVIKLQSMLPSADSNRPSHPGVRFGLVACAYGDNMFIFGGQQQSKLVGAVLYRLDLENFTWQQIATTGSPPAQRTYATGCLVGNRWFIHGGSSADDVFADCHELNLDLLHWHPSTNLFSNVTLEGHSSASVSTEMGVSSVLLIGGATGGPNVPKGPMMQCDFVLPDTPVSDDTRLEDCLIRPVEASRLYWLMYRQLHSRGYSVSGGYLPEASRVTSVQKELAEVRNKLRALQLQHETLLQSYRLSEESKRELDELLGKAQVLIDQPTQAKIDSTASAGSTSDKDLTRLRQVAETSRQELSRLTRKYKEIATREQTTVAHVRIVKESATETRDLFSSDFMPELRILTTNLELEQVADGTLRRAGELVEFGEEVERRLQTVVDSLSPIKTEASSPVGKTSDPVVETTSQTRSSTTSRKQEVFRTNMKNKGSPGAKGGSHTSPGVDIASGGGTAQVSGVNAGAKVSETNVQSVEVGVEVGKPVVLGVTVGVSSHVDPTLGKLDLGRGSVDRKSSLRSGRGSGRMRKGTEERSGYVGPGIDCAAQCGTGVLKLRPLPTSTAPSRSMSTVTSQQARGGPPAMEMSRGAGS